jgi:hypothetical protein
VGSGTVTCLTVLDLAFSLTLASALSHVPQLWASPPCRGGLWHRHVSRGPGPRLLAEVSSGSAACPTAPDLTSLLRCELQRCHVPHGSGLCLSERRAPVLPCVPRPPVGMWTLGIKKGLAALGTQLGSRVFKTHSCVTEAHVRHADRYSATL